MNKEEYKDYLKLSGKITEKLDNTATYENWLIIQEYIDRAQQKVEQLEKENEKLKQPQVFIDCEDMEERYGRDLYEDYLKEKIEQLENIRKEAIEYIEENSQSYSLPGVIKDMRYVDFNKLLNILNKGDNNE